ncbi:major facilitator superfamily transporter [Xylariaceae sp. FL1272]|nr:major facilitator superfamily transporter [Xylariaceae sp. FL1272]
MQHESGLGALIDSCRDTKALCLQRFVRFFAYGASFLVLVDFLKSLGISDEKVGVFMTSTLVGDAVISFFLTTFADRVGRRRVLFVGAGLMAASGIAFSLSKNYWLLLTASIFGVISPSGNEIGPFKAVEESILAQLTDETQRSDIFAWYTLIGSAGAALGALAGGWTVQLFKGVDAAGPNYTPYRVIFMGYALLGIVKFVLTLYLTPTAFEVKLDNEELLSDESDDDDPARPHTARPERPPTSSTKPISPASYSVVCRLLLLFFLDSFASGLASPSWLTYFFTSVHSLEPGLLGTLFLVTGVLATFSNLAALPLSRRIGPIKTIVFTHLPSAVFLGLVPLPPPKGMGTLLAAAFLTLRACTQSIDQAPKQAFLASAVIPSNRTAVLGIVNISKTIAQASGISASGFLAGKGL